MSAPATHPPAPRSHLALVGEGSRARPVLVRNAIPLIGLRVQRSVLVVVWLLLGVLASSVAEEFRRGCETTSAAQTRLEFNWDFSMHLARIGVILPAGFFFGRDMIIPPALALSCVEIYPVRSLRLMGGDATLESGNERRSRD